MKLRNLIFAAVVGIGGCVASGHATMGVESTGTVYQDPPPPRQETYEARSGFVFVKGRWAWTNGQWQWTAGHWERERSGYAWTDGHWEHRGNRWDWVEGSWVNHPSGPVAQGGVSVSSNPPPPYEQPRPPVAQGGVSVTYGEYPNEAPPPVRSESPGARAGFVWVTGRWDWQRGKGWVWADGHWERERANQIWVAGRWEQQGNRWVWVEGRWDRGAPAGPVVRDHR
ncbi:MAG TPA: hypothetical protein VGC41_20980 [Kofleriaceae bacterium]